MNIYQKLAAAREQFHGLKVKPSGQNKFAGYTYYELSDIVVPGLKCLHENGLTALPMSSDGVRCTMQVVELEGEGVIEFQIPISSARLKGCHEVQNLGAVWTYNRRYLWSVLLEVVEPSVLDTGEEPAPKATDDATEKQMNLIFTLAKNGAIPEDAMKKLEAKLEKGPLNVREASAWIDRAILRSKEQEKENDE